MILKLMQDAILNYQIKIIDLINDSSLTEACDIENDADCTENQDYQVEINGYDLKDPEDDLYYYISSQTTSNNETQSLFKKINFSNDIFNNDNLVNPNLIFNDEIIVNSLLKLDLTIISKILKYLNTSK